MDILYVHNIGGCTHGEADHARHMADHMGSGLDRLRRLREQGRMRAFGLGVNETQVCLDVMTQARVDVIALAGQLTLLDRSAEATSWRPASERGRAWPWAGSSVWASWPQDPCPA